MRTARRLAIPVVVAGQLLWLAISLYQSAITIAGRIRPPLPTLTRLPPSPPRVALVACARNEEAVIPGVVLALRSQEYPADRFEVFVVAHNCTDGTASAAARAGAQVVEARTREPGKAHAIRAALDAIGGGWDLVGVFDADSRVSPNLLATVIANRGDADVVQVETVPHDTHDWVATGYGFGRRARNLFWWRPREALGLGTTISGSGYFTDPGTLRRLIDGCQTITEDLEATARLYAEGGRVTYVSETYVQVEEPQSLPASLQQRLRWVRGHLSVVRLYWPALALRGVRGDLRALDMAIYLISPTRMLTRLAVTSALVISVLRLPGAIHPLPVALAFGGEWGLPLGIAIRERLLPPTPRGLALALRHGVLSLLWFPIGLWGLLSVRKAAWEPTPRAASPNGTDDAVRAN